MDFHLVKTQTKKIPLCLSELENHIERASHHGEDREDFYHWYQRWYANALAELGQVTKCLTELESEALNSKNSSLIERQAVKDAIDMESLFSSLNDLLKNMSESVQLQMRFGHIWKYWNLNLCPFKKQLEVALRKFEVASTGL